MGTKNSPRIPLPKSWGKHVRIALLHVVALARYATAYTRGWATNSLDGRVILKAENDRLQQEIALLREEIRIKDARMMLITPQRRPVGVELAFMRRLEAGPIHGNASAIGNRRSSHATSRIRQRLRLVYLRQSTHEHVPHCNNTGTHRAFSRDQGSSRKEYDQEILCECFLLRRST